MLKVLDLFSGIGGFSLGLEATGGFETVAFCEIDPFCRRVLAKHWPGVQIIEDVRTDTFPDADIIVGGFPCQDVSRAGKRAGVSGERSGLYRELVRAVRLVRPRHAILENVAALLGDGMGDVLGDLAKSGDCIEWDCVPACAIGAPHQRDRVWIVAHATRNDDVAHNAETTDGPVPEFGNGACAGTSSDSQSIGCGPRGARQPPDSFAWIRDPSRWHASDADDKGFSGSRQETGVAFGSIVSESFGYPWKHDAWQSGWPSEPALLGVDDGIPDRAHRVRALGNTLLPQIPYLIGRAILEAEGAEC